MGGCGGKKLREKRKAGSSTVGGKFASTGSREEQQANLVLVARLLGEIGSDGARLASSDDRLFLQDVRIKMNQMGAHAIFGWRQVAKMVEVHAGVTAKRGVRADG